VPRPIVFSFEAIFFEFYRMKFRWIILGMMVLCLLVVAGVLADWLTSIRPTDYPRQYVGRDSCVSCHQAQADLHYGSHHDRAMDVANEDTVLADFNEQELEHFGVVSKMYRHGQRWMVRTDGPNGEMTDFEVKYVFGYYPLQQYMVEIDRPENAKPHEIGRVQVLRESWDVEQKKWFYLMPPDVSEHLDPTDPLHWTGITQNWNSSCAYCHSTNVQKNFDPFTAQYRTTFSEINVSCEACHGPGSLHVELANRRSLFWDRNHHYGLAKLKTESNQPQVETCAQCHSRRNFIANGFQPGCNYEDYFSLQLLTDPVYHLDGQQRNENFVYGSFIQSRMYHNGIKCSDCHDPHSIKLKHEGNQVCTSCHQHPAGKYDTELHHHHPVGAPGSFCVDCHMPETTYMMCDPRRDHSFRVPRPDLSVEFGTPNACTGCHIDPSKLNNDPDRKPLRQYADWIDTAGQGDEDVAEQLKTVNKTMLDAVHRWFPLEQSDVKSMYYEQLTVGQAKTAESLANLLQLARDRSAPAVFRASALQVAATDTSPESFAAAMAGLKDNDPKVIAAALNRLEQEVYLIADQISYTGLLANQQQRLQEIVRAVAPLLQHSLRRVRIEAGRMLLSVPAELRTQFVTNDQRKALEAATDEYRQSLFPEQDRANFQLALASLAELLGKEEQAIDHYRTAMKIEPYLTGPRANLAALFESQKERLENQMSQWSAQQKALRSNSALAQIDKWNDQILRWRSEEHRLLAKDIERAAGLANIDSLHYRYAMSCYLQNDLANTEKHLLEAHRQSPDNTIYLMGLATYYLQVKQAEKALPFVQRLLEIEPEHPAYKKLMEEAYGQN
jgi:tetratricopeptide (TPR) repeat protein